MTDYPLKFYPAKPSTLHRGSDLYNRLIEDDGWIIEPKKNGKRCIVTCEENNQTHLWSRQGNEFTQDSKELRQELPKLFNRCFIKARVNTIFDGELFQKNGKQELWIFDRFYIFDYIYSQTHLSRRRNRVTYPEFGSFKYIKFIPWFVGKQEKEKAYETCLANGDEGIVFKKLDSVYPVAQKPGEETTDWLKVKPIIEW